MNAPQKSGTPAGRPGHGKKEAQTASSYSANAAPVNLRGSVLICGQCPCYREKVGERGRRHCRYLGQSVRLGDPCHVDPMSPKFDAWIAEEERRERGVEL